MTDFLLFRFLASRASGTRPLVLPGVLAGGPPTGTGRLWLCGQHAVPGRAARAETRRHSDPQVSHRLRTPAASSCVFKVPGPPPGVGQGSCRMRAVLL